MMRNFSITEQSALPPELLERTLLGLGIDSQPQPTLAGLAELYGAWCQKVPFDNIRKLIHVRPGKPGPLPGTSATDFFEAWLKFGTGGTCWANATALHSLLVGLGFDAIRGIGTMMAAPELPPNHGTVIVKFGQDTYLVDSSILHGEPLRLDAGSETSVQHAAWGVKCAMRHGRWFINWRPLHKLDGFDCRLERFGASGDEFRTSYDQTRGWSPFNYQVTARVNRHDRVTGIAFGNIVSIEKDGKASQRPSSADDRKRLLIEEIGISEELVQQLPDDVATPPPPGSRTAAGA